MKKVNIFKRVAVLAGIAGMFCVMGSFLVGCGGNNTSTASSTKVDDIGEINLAVVYANRANSASGIDDSVLEPYVMSALVSGGTISAIKCDGNPKQIDYDISKFKSSKKQNSTNVEKENKRVVKEFIEVLKSDAAKAQASEVDTVSAITAASKTLPTNTNKQNIIFVMDSGISTSGRINFLDNNILYNDPELMLASSNTPNMKHIDGIVWTGFGAVDAPQSSIPSDYPIYERIQLIYSNFFKASGVKGENTINWISNSAGIKPADRENLPKVSSVNFDVSRMFSDNWNQIKLDECMLRFMPDSAEFADESNSRAILSEVADSVIKNGCSIQIDGYIASNGVETGNLSLRRAEAVMNQLAELGVPLSNMNASGKGAGPYPYMVNGKVNAANRYVMITKH